MQSDVEDPQILSRRLGDFIKAQGPTKDVARRIQCDERTLENIRAGRTWPIARHWLRIWFEFGDDVLEAVFYPERVEARLAREADAREQARQQRIASASRMAVEKAFRLGRRVGEPHGEDEDLGPPNLDLFLDRTP